ncbi:hypothetical protein L226DRAFT_528953 [Lentinus tigrinus ALCF2SS1-7]|uniref:T6SS Phospholipase effector Tle1-like catalytic domain-containing protein n=1 Tax=Lentinus tigrinus ALCF2SS1-6 TaxID=1328759 RepID=A0A5C2SLP7_9APHY|nr:hypothetical protein L227DRAFT_571134 [Lentinus tigrinus ALCF2SS1-6]RPD82826.1 hypothetical protein L226DRAFT_528953 [Lentinus tigrinus ALCF2SS1-7]
MASRPAMPFTRDTPASLNLQNHAQGSSAPAAPEAHSHSRPLTPSSVHSWSSELDHDIIPPYHPGARRTLVLCFDGTGDQFDSDNSNVVKFFSMLKRDDRREQMVYYQTGIGTYTSPQLVTAVGQAVSKTLDEAVAWNLDTHVMAGYEFLMQNYEVGDKICLFGFSRGAYTARALAGMLHKVGLLPSHNHQQIPFAYKMYMRTDALGWKQSTAFKKAFSIDVDIDFIGVWDTVCSVGLIPQRLPFTASNTAIRTFRHALSLDERRAKFKANTYNRPSEWESQQGTHPGDMPKPYVRRASTNRKSRSQSPHKPMSPSRLLALMKPKQEVTAVASTVRPPTPTETAEESVVAVAEQAVEKKVEAVVDEAGKEAEVAVEAVEKTTEAVTQSGSRLWSQTRSRFDTLRTLMRKKGKRLTEEEEEFNKTEEIHGQGETDVKEVWFAGCHCDVGGGSVLDSEKHSLARIPLRWMIRECFRTNTGIRFHSELLKDIGLDPDTLYPHAKEGIAYGPGLAHAPQIPPLNPSPRISLDPPTPPERTQADVEKQVGHAAAASTSSSPQMHTRHISTSTARTLIGTTTTTAGSPRFNFHKEPVEVHVDEEEEEARDAACAIYDQLQLKLWWWILELLPIEQRKQLPNNKWKKYTSFNLGRGRTIPADTGKFFVHRSVKTRMERVRGYKPRAENWDDQKPVYVD